MRSASGVVYASSTTRWHRTRRRFRPATALAMLRAEKMGQSEETTVDVRLDRRAPSSARHATSLKIPTTTATSAATPPAGSAAVPAAPRAAAGFRLVCRLELVFSLMPPRRGQRRPLLLGLLGSCSQLLDFELQLFSQFFFHLRAAGAPWPPPQRRPSRSLVREPRLSRARGDRGGVAGTSGAGSDSSNSASTRCSTSPSKHASPSVSDWTDGCSISREGRSRLSGPTCRP